jgi:hypothetical protein
MINSLSYHLGNTYQVPKLVGSTYKVSIYVYVVVGTDMKY